MNSLKKIALRAKNRLLNKGLRDTYSSANVMYGNNMMFNNNNNWRRNNNDTDSPLKYLFKNERMLNMPANDRERFILDTIRKYQEEKHKQNKSFI